jgi:hypothetical protein
VLSIFWEVSKALVSLVAAKAFSFGSSGMEQGSKRFEYGAINLAHH